jgi:hypothetical protein
MSELLGGTVATVLAAAVAVLVLHTLARRSAPVTDTASTAVAEPGAGEAPGGSREFAALLDPDAWQCEVVFDLATATTLLDRAEADGYEERELVVLGPSAFLVRWRRPS